jgi:ankyrin repeat protein
MKHSRAILLLSLLLIGSVFIWRASFSWPLRTKAAIREGDIPALQKLVVDPNVYVAVTGKMRAPLLHIAASEGQMNVVDWHLEKGADPKLADTEGATALTYVIGHLSLTNVDRGPLLEKLLKAGASPDAGNQRRVSAIIKAAMLDDETALKVMLPYSKLANQTDKFGCTALHYADKPEVFQILTNAGWDPEIKNDDGQTPAEMISVKSRDNE